MNDTMADALQWEQDNPVAFESIRKYALQLLDAGCYVSSRYLLEHERVFGKVMRTHDDYKINNNLIPAIGRLLILREPCLTRAIRLRLAKSDQQQLEVIR